MSKIILAINAGSSSVKVSVFSYTPTNSTNNPPSSKDNPDQIDPSLTELAQIQISNLTASPALLTYTLRDQPASQKNSPLPASISTPRTAFQKILSTLLQDPDLPELNSPSDITVAVHRIVHGGGDFSSPTFLDDDETVAHLERLSDLAPLHNGGALEIVAAVRELCQQGDAMGGGQGKVRNLGLFDNMFHSSLPAEEREYMISPAKARSEGLRRYGFHGLSCAFITRAVGAWLQNQPKPSLPPLSQQQQQQQQQEQQSNPPQGRRGPNLIALHLGSGCSATCIRAGVSIATSMGLTPVSGLPGATRSGDVDPSLIFHYTHSAGKLSTASAAEAQQADGGGEGGGKMHITRAEEILNKESGWKSLAGTTDFGKLCAMAFPASSSSSSSSSSNPNNTPNANSEEDRQLARLAFEILVTRIVDFIAAYYVKLCGEVDALVFAGGIGEKGSQLREAVVERIQCLGFEIDGEANGNPSFTKKDEEEEEGVVAGIGRPGAKHRVVICQTDEQREMARECVGVMDGEFSSGGR
ncbi:acetate kinase [Hortaea werneckii]|nr:acetate kinase [Hortaea werneckii]KAI7309167.1 acetate kinase [Hortaea werneckii]